jgi:hypothetical protein
MPLLRNKYELGRHCQGSRERLTLRSSTPLSFSLQIYLPVLPCLQWYDSRRCLGPALAMADHRFCCHLSSSYTSSLSFLLTGGTQSSSYAIYFVECTFCYQQHFFWAAEPLAIPVMVFGEISICMDTSEIISTLWRFWSRHRSYQGDMCTAAQWKYCLNLSISVLFYNVLYRRQRVSR